VNRYGEVALGVECALPRTVPAARRVHRSLARLALAAALAGALYAGVQTWKEAPLGAGSSRGAPSGAVHPAASVAPCAPPPSVRAESKDGKT